MQVGEHAAVPREERIGIMVLQRHVPLAASQITIDKRRRVDLPAAAVRRNAEIASPSSKNK